MAQFPKWIGCPNQIKSQLYSLRESYTQRHDYSNINREVTEFESRLLAFSRRFFPPSESPNPSSVHKLRNRTQHSDCAHMSLGPLPGIKPSSLLGLKEDFYLQFLELQIILLKILSTGSNILVMQQDVSSCQIHLQPFGNFFVSSPREMDP